MLATIIDTETTGVEAPDVIQLAHLGPVEFFHVDLAATPVQSQRFKPGKAIALGAMAAHHIIAEDLDDAPPWPGTWSPPAGTEYLIGHNIDFDWQAIGSPVGFRRICTLTLARALWPALDSHSLGALAYHCMPHREARELVRGAHDASRDVVMCSMVCSALLLTLGSSCNSWEALWKASETARIPTRFTFGKYGPNNGEPGRLISEIRRQDPGYIEWCMYKCDMCADEYWQRALRGQA